MKKEIIIEPQLFCSKHILEVRRIGPIENQRWIKPKGGLWTSTYTPDSKFCSEWIWWCNREMVEWIESTKCYILLPKKNVRVYVIDDYFDLEKLHEEYGIKKFSEVYAVFDWEKIEIDYDGVMLTDKGEGETRHTRPLNLNGWDCESTIWFRNVFKRIISIERDRDRICKMN